MEILNNTILKLVFRQGTDTERKHIKFTSGEPAFVTDTGRLFIGTGNLSGGKLVGNLSLSSTADLTTLEAGYVGDIAFDTDNNKLHRIFANDGSTITDWEVIGGVYSSGDNYITIDNANNITLNALSANALSNDLVSGTIILDSGRLALSSNIPFQSVSTKTMLVSGGLTATANGVNVTGSAVNPLSSNLVITSNEIFGKYQGSLSSLSYSRNVTSVTYLSSGHYRFNFPALPTAQYIPSSSIFGISPENCYTRVISTTTTTCDVVVLSTNGVKTDADVFLLINY